MSAYVFVALNTILCSAIMFTCLCRLSVSDCRVLGRVRFGYSILGASFLAMLLGPMYGEWPGWSHIAAGLGVEAVLISGAHRWKYGAAPMDVRSDWDCLTGPP